MILRSSVLSCATISGGVFGRREQAGPGIHVEALDAGFVQVGSSGNSVLRLMRVVASAAQRAGLHVRHAGGEVGDHHRHAPGETSVSAGGALL